MLRLVSAGILALLLGGCPVEQPAPIPPPPPRAFLSFPNTTILAPSIKGSLTTTGCRKVAQVQILESGNFIADARYSGEPTSFELIPSLFNSIYPQRGFATPLSLTAKVVCEEFNTQADGGMTVREGLSQPIAITFLPVSNVRTDMGRQTLPDTFVAEGGVGGQPTTFVGCVGTNTGSALVRVDQNGVIRAVNASLPFACSYSSGITPLNATTQTRWLWVSQVGTFAFDGNLNITAVYQGFVSKITVSPDGDAVVGIEELQAPTSRSEILRLRVRPTGGQPVKMWSSLDGPFSTGFPGSMNADLVVDTGNRRVFASSWQKRASEMFGRMAVLIYNYDTGTLVNGDTNGMVPALLEFAFPDLVNRALTPIAAFKEDGQLLYAPVLVVDRNNMFSTTVLACATNTPGCQGSARRWTSPTFQGELTTVVLFSRGNFLAVLGPYSTYFLGANDGQVKNLGGVQPLRPSGSLVTLGVVPGKANDFYLLNGPPPPDQNTPTFPTEVIATDAPSTGELWKFEVQGGSQPANSLYLAVDDNGQAWMRVGVDQVRPLGLMEYRNQRGATTPP